MKGHGMALILWFVALLGLLYWRPVVDRRAVRACDKWYEEVSRDN